MNEDPLDGERERVAHPLHDSLFQCDSWLKLFLHSEQFSCSLAEMRSNMHEHVDIACEGN